MGEPPLAAATARAKAPLVGRERELGALDGLLAWGTEGRSQLVVVEGAAGIGKSRLIMELRERAAARGVAVLAAHGAELEREFPFGVVRQLFEPLLAHAAERERLLVDAAVAAGPVFEEVHPGGTGGDASFAALHGLYWLTVNVASEQPLLLAVDDLQWCDRGSLRFLAYLARRLEGVSAVLAVGLRTAEPGTDPVLIGEVADAPGAVHLQPGPLGETSVAELVRARLGAEPDRAFTEACLTATGGNPLLLRQLLTSLEADGVTPTPTQVRAVWKVGPAAVSRTVLRRLHGLPNEAAAVARAVAVLGDGAQLPLVAALARLEEDAAARAMAALARAEILRREPPLGFEHPLVRDAIYHESPVGERELDHARAAVLLNEANAPAEEVATHLLGSPRRGQEWMVDVLAEAAESARSRGAADSAAAYLARAFEEPPPPERRAQVLLQLGLAETLTSGPSAAAHLRQAWETLDEPRERAQVAALLARTLIYTAPAQEAVAFARSAGAEIPPELADERQALRAVELYAVPLGTGDEDAAALLGDVRIEGEGPGAKMLAAAAALGLALTGASAEECAALAEEALAGGVLIDADPGILTGAGWVLMMADREEALAAWDEMRAKAHRRGSLFGFLGSNLGSGAALLWRGDFPEAESRLVAGFDRLVGKGISYGAARSEASNAHGLDVHIVGAGNSAGQAALFFSNHARSVTLLCRGDSLDRSMSRYLIDQLATRSNIGVMFETEVAAVHGDTSLDAIDVQNGETAETTRLESGVCSSSSERMPKRRGCRPRSRSPRKATSSRAPTCRPPGAGNSTAIPTCSRRASPVSSPAATCATAR